MQCGGSSSIQITPLYVVMGHEMHCNFGAGAREIHHALAINQKLSKQVQPEKKKQNPSHIQTLQEGKKPWVGNEGEPTANVDIPTTYSCIPAFSSYHPNITIYDHYPHCHQKEG